MGRFVEEDYPLDKYAIPKGSSLLFSQYEMHNDSKYYDKPEIFANCDNMVYGDDRDIIYVKERNNYVPFAPSNLRVVQVGHESMRLNSY